MKGKSTHQLIGLCLATLIGLPVAATAANGFLDKSAIKFGLTYDAVGTNSLEFARRTNPANHEQVFFIGMNNKLNINVGAEHKLEDEDARIFLEYDRFSKDSLSIEDTTTYIFDSRQQNPVRATGEVSYELDLIKFGSRHRLHFGPRFMVDLGAGVSWMDLDSNQTTSEGPAGEPLAVLKEERDFRGVGPYLDFTTRCYPNHWLKRYINGLHLVAHGGMSLLYSNSKYRAQNFDSSGMLIHNFERESVKSVATELIGRLALGWDTLYSNRSQLTILLGYQVKYYGGALAYGEWSAPGMIAATQGDAIAGFGGSSVGQALTRQGPFLEFKFSGSRFNQVTRH